MRGLVEQALGGRARYRLTEIQSVEKLLQEAPRTTQAPPDPSLVESPEVQAALTEMLRQHYENWVNAPLPALGGRTPLAAVRDADGREIVESLIVQIERDGKRMVPPLDEAIVRRMRERLGLLK